VGDVIATACPSDWSAGHGRPLDGTLEAMGYTRWLAGEILDLVRANRFWMTWNLILAFIPAFLAVLLFWPPHRRTFLWWCGVCVFVLFLPNAPYVVTDLIHMRGDAASAASDGVLVFGVLPLYGAFIAVGFGCFLVCLELIVREVRSMRPGASRWSIELTTSAVCALGIVLGRLARLNSWDTVENPRRTAEQIFTTLTWKGSPFIFTAILLAVVVTTAVLRALLAPLAALTARAREHPGVS